MGNLKFQANSVEGNLLLWPLLQAEAVIHGVRLALGARGEDIWGCVEETGFPLPHSHCSSLFLSKGFLMKQLRKTGLSRVDQWGMETGILERVGSTR